MTNYEFVIVFFRQAQLKKSKQIFKIQNVQVDVLPRTYLTASFFETLAISYKILMTGPFSNRLDFTFFA